MTTADGRDRGEPAQAIFDRINRRRAARHAALTASAGAPAADAAALRIDELVDAGPGPAGSAAQQVPMHEPFPRSAIVRTLLRHPLLAVGVGVPAAVLLLRAPAARRLVQTGLVLGARPEVRAVLGSALAAATSAFEERRRRPGESGAGGTDAVGTAPPAAPPAR